jgi:hypothetical protein
MSPTNGGGQAPGGFLDSLKSLLSGLVQQAMAKMGGGQASAPSSGIPNLPASMQAGNSKLFSDGSQNNTYVQGQVAQYMAQQKAAQAKAQADGIAAHNRSLKREMKNIPPIPQAQPGTGVTAPTGIQQLIQSIPQAAPSKIMGQ